MAEVLQIDDADIWDDSALIQSWDAALAEYKRYHSIQARGEKVEDVLSEHELTQLKKDLFPSSTTVDKSIEIEDPEAMEEGELDEEVPEPMQAEEKEPVEVKSGPAEEANRNTNPVTATPPEPSIATMPQVLLSSVQDESLKSLMMSWYYAGYYTGLYQGQQMAKDSSTSQMPGANGRPTP